MGYYVKVEPDVKIYVEDLNEGADKTILFIHGCQEVINCLNINLMFCQRWDIDALG